MHGSPQRDSGPMEDADCGRERQDRPMTSSKLSGSAESFERSASAYWRAHLRLIFLLLAVWFAAGLGCGVLWREFLDHARLSGTGFPLGFWFAQQGSIYVFVVLIWIYVWRMDRLDRRFGFSEQADLEGR